MSEEGEPLVRSPNGVIYFFIIYMSPSSFFPQFLVLKLVLRIFHYFTLVSTLIRGGSTDFGFGLTGSLKVPAWFAM